MASRKKAQTEAQTATPQTDAPQTDAATTGVDTMPANIMPVETLPMPPVDNTPQTEAQTDAAIVVADDMPAVNTTPLPADSAHSPTDAAIADEKAQAEAAQSAYAAWLTANPFECKVIAAIGTGDNNPTIKTLKRINVTWPMLWSTLPADVATPINTLRSMNMAEAMLVPTVATMIRGHVVNMGVAFDAANDPTVKLSALLSTDKIIALRTTLSEAWFEWAEAVKAGMGDSADLLTFTHIAVECKRKAGSTGGTGSKTQKRRAISTLVETHGDMVIGQARVKALSIVFRENDAMLTADGIVRDSGGKPMTWYKVDGEQRKIVNDKGEAVKECNLALWCRNVGQSATARADGVLTPINAWSNVKASAAGVTLAKLYDHGVNAATMPDAADDAADDDDDDTADM